ncbi:hypothetical protein QA798_08520 [Mycolicibacterium fortuitum]|nr:hypothetical protein [Mycolicibacterium fortuitum]MDG5769987.1 hypothetical protein [Mycolicibacterium fortuitum]
MELIAGELALCEFTLGVRERCGDAILLGTQLVEWNSARVVSAQQRVAFIGELFDPAFGHLHPFVAHRQEDVEVRDDVIADSNSESLRKLAGFPVIFDQRLDGRDGYSLEVARRSLGLPPKAVEVRVSGSLPVTHYLDAEHVAAVSAVQGSLEIVGVLLWFLARPDASFTDCLNLLPLLFGDQRFVASGMPCSFELDESEVVAVAQDVLDV